MVLFLLERGMCNKTEKYNIKVLYIVGKYLHDYKTCLFSRPPGLNHIDLNHKNISFCYPQLSFKNITYLCKPKFNYPIYYHKGGDLWFM